MFIQRVNIGRPNLINLVYTKDNQKFSLMNNCGHILWVTAHESQDGITSISIWLNIFNNHPRPLLQKHTMKYRSIWGLNLECISPNGQLEQFDCIMPQIRKILRKENNILEECFQFTKAHIHLSHLNDHQQVQQIERSNSS
ncbi:hypothetical protein FGO68_gene14332 [Halteria grandinella]|uniref:Uncharacterized protein n=1 Tax=Halteria grandinella TaxID=5974 RepID=A0A8J8NZF3_HALGN|nr:hypothetical protein FGO68_gene14332 [Halteria grandinella]